MNNTKPLEKSSVSTLDYTKRGETSSNIAQSPRADGSRRAVAEAQLPHEAGFTPRVYRTGFWRFAVDSKTDPDVTYFVQLRAPGAEPHCQCLGFQYRKHCRHIDAAEARDAEIEARRGAIRERIDAGLRRPAGMAALQEAFSPAVAS